MTQRRARRTSLALVAVAVLGAGAFSGCGLTDSDPAPGAAAVVGDETVGVEQVDSATRSLCTVLAADPDAQSEGYPMGVLRSAMQRGLALESMAEQVAAEYGVDVAAQLEQGTAPVRQAYAGADPDDVEQALPAFIGDGYLGLVLQTVAAEELGDDADQEAVLARANEIGAQWADEHGVRSSPAFEELVFTADGIDAQRAELSVPVSEWARRAVAPASAEDAAALVGDLPASQRCLPES